MTKSTKSDSRFEVSNRRSDRREFLERSMLATAAALAAQSQWGASALAQDSTGPISPNEQIHVAVIGANGRGQSHVDGFAGKKGTIVTHICDCDEKVGQQVCEKTAEKQNGKKPTFVKDLRALLEDKTINAVSIATPNHWHSLAAIWAVQAGKDVYVEKPVSHNVLEGRRLVQVARKHNRMVQTGTQSRSNPGMRESMEFIHSGGIGEVTVARGLCYKRRGSIGPKGTYEVPKSVDYDLWSGPAPILPLTRKNFHYDWHWQWAYGNGDLGNQGIHQMDLCRWALNESRLSDRTFSLGGRLGYEDAGETANTQLVIHDYGKKQLAFEVRGLPTGDYKGAMVGIIVEGSKGYLVMTSYSSGTVFNLDGEVVKTFNGGGDGYHYKNFEDAVRARDYKLLNADCEEGHYSSALCHLGNISLQLGTSVRKEDVAAKLADIEGPSKVGFAWDRTVAHLKENTIEDFSVSVGPALPLDSKSETFVNNDKANQMLSREYRKNYELPSEANL
ncbi:MAG: Gfo/Idh/MocA family protein [Pirellula sp.]|jgi:predicted dehydrogenase